MTADLQAWRRRLEASAADPKSAPLLVSRCVVQELDLDGVGVSVSTASGSRAIVCATDDRAQRVEDLQFTLGVGPCVDAVVHGGAVFVPDVHDPDDLDLERWPGFLAALDAAGVRALFAVPLRIGALRIGAVDLHRTRPGPLGTDELQQAFVAAEVIACALLDANVPASSTGGMPWPGLSAGMHVHQATGMVKAQLDVDIGAALLALRARAFTEGRALTDLARDVVERRVRFDGGDRP